MKTALLFLLIPAAVFSGVGDPQIGTDHPFYSGEMHCSSFARLFASQAEQYRRVTGIDPKTEHDRALASWFWRNTHFAHGEEGAENLWGTGFKSGDLRTREYWTGLFAHGFGLCGTTHAQWTAEFEQLLGHGRGRGLGVAGHNSFEVFLTGGPYGEGRWALLDHDVSTVVFDATGKALLGVPAVKNDLKRLTDRKFSPEKQNGWLVCGLHPGDGGVYSEYKTAEYLAGYAGAPPTVHLRRGERLRRYFEPGLEDGKTYVFWGRNYGTAGIPGPERSQTWVNQPGKMYGSREGTGYKPGQARFGNAVYEYTPDFARGDYREGVSSEDGGNVTFEFYTPYIIGATPPNDSPWGVYDAGGRNGLVLRGRAKCDVAVSVDQGATWSKKVPFEDGLDLTDLVKGYRQYLIAFHAGAKALAGTGLTMRTVCQANPAIFPRLNDGETSISIESSGRAMISAGPNKPQAAAHIVAGAFGKPDVTLEIPTPRGESGLFLYAAAHLASGNPPRPDVNYHISFSTDAGKTWQPLVADWKIPRRADEPGDFWSQSLCYGGVELKGGPSSARVRFHNDGGKPVLRAEAHLAYRVAREDAVAVTFDWIDDAGSHQQRFVAPAGKRSTFQQVAGKGVRTRWVEMAPVW